MVLTTGPYARPKHQTEITLTQNSLVPVQLTQRVKRLVVKFGGSSLSDRERIERAARLVAKESKKGTKLVVVVSAIGKTTEHLISLVNHSDKSPNKTDLDDVLAMGERTSVRVFATALKRENLDVRYFDPSDRDWPIITDDQFSNANPVVELCIQRVRDHVVPMLDWGTVPVIAGFVGRSMSGRVSTIGRGGSDTTAFILARGIDADEVVLVTDAEGILSADPKLVSSAKRLDQIDVKTLIRLADSGTKFIHRKALRYKDPNIPVRVISHSKEDLNAEGTIITGGVSNEIEVSFESNTPTMSVTLAGKGISENPEIITEISESVKKHSTLNGLSADFDSVILYVPQSSSPALLPVIHDVITSHGEAMAMAVQRDLAFIRIKGVGLEDTPGIIGRMSTLLQETGINISGMLTLASSILVFLSWEDKEVALDLMKRVVKESL